MMMQPMDMVKQTGKTIIFEEFNRDKKDLVSLLTKDETELSFEKYVRLIDSELGVKSFVDFVEKFSPIVYETPVMTEDGSVRFVYSLEKLGPGDECKEIQLKDQAFYGMVMDLIDRKANSDKGNFEFPYEDLKRALTPEAEMEECRKIRKNLLINYEEYSKLVERGEPSPELDRLEQNINAIRNKIVDKYCGSPIALLPLILKDKQTQIELLKAAEVPKEGSDEVKTIPCKYTFDDSGNLLPEPIDEKESDDAIEVAYDDSGNLLPTPINENVSGDTLKKPAQENNAQLANVVKEDFKEFAPPTMKKSDYMANMVASVFVPSGGALPSTQDRVVLEAEKKKLQDVYGDSLESFAKAVAGVIEKFAGVKSFFDHATCDGELPRDVSVIISNCKVDALLKDANDPKGPCRRFTNFCDKLRNEKDVNRIWFAIIPAISTGEEVSSNISNVKSKASKIPEGLGRLRRDEPSDSFKEKKDRSGVVGLDTVKSMLTILSKAKIMTFVNYKAGEDTGFVGLTKKKVEQYKKDFESLPGEDAEYAVFVYPNFTILPEEESSLRIGTKYRIKDGRQVEVDAYVGIPGIYLDAAYVACGMMVGVQNYRFLKKKRYVVTPKYPCVRFDLEAPENSKRVTTKLNRETTTEMSEDIKSAITDDRFGFVFADDKIVFDGRALNNSYVLNARSLRKDETGKYKPLYKTLVKNLVWLIIKTLEGTTTKSTIDKFINDYVTVWQDDYRSSEYVNSILYRDEKIFLNSENKLIVEFGKEPDSIEVDIDDSVSSEEKK